MEIRNTIAQFEEPAPLYGFLRYRRRNVLIKYVPEECSRLVQGENLLLTLKDQLANISTARVSVHFNAITERFSPHDTEFSISSSKELRDTTLSAACSLHTASGSLSSSTSSLRRRRLMEIAEEAEEDAKRQSTVPEERPSTAKASPMNAASVPLPASPPTLTNTNSYRSVISDLETFPPPPRESQLDLRPPSPTKTLDDRHRKSSQSVRPDLYSLPSYGSSGKPKIKLGPRPSLDVGGRPHTSSATSHFRPVSTLPAGLKLFSRGSKKEKERPKSHLPTEPPSMTISPPPVPDTAAGSLQSTHPRPHTSGGRPTTSSGISIKSAASPRSGTFPKMPTITPEKARLMKALELRKKRELAPPTVLAELNIPNAEEGLANPPTDRAMLSNGPPQDVHDNSLILNEMTRADDSGIAFDASSTMKTDESDATRSDSYPVSPVGPSERAESTKASSISESTDETVQEADTSKHTLGAPNSILEEIGFRAEDPPKTDPIIQEEVENEVERNEELPLLKPVTYSPVPSPVAIRANNMEEKITQDAEGSTHTDANEKTLREPSFPQEPSQQDAHSTTSIPEVEIRNSIYIMPNGEIPISKDSPQNLKAASDGPLVSTDPLPLVSSGSAANAGPKSPAGSSFSNDTKRSLNDDDQQENRLEWSKRRKREGHVDPIRTDFDATDISAANSVANFSSDDELMEELQSAVFQEAKPMSVAKSPISPVFPSPKKTGGNKFSRVFSSPMRKETPDSQKLTTPKLGESESFRSVSGPAAYLNRIHQEPTKPLAKKVNLGSGISQRIKALEKLSANAPGASISPGTTAPGTGASPAFFSVRNGNAQTASRSPSIAERASSLTRHTPSPSPSVSRESSPETLKLRDRSGSVQNRLNAFSAAPLLSTPQHSRPESISVTARIIRDPIQTFPSAELGKDPSEYAPLDLKQSPLVIDHQKAIVAPPPPKETIQERRLSTSSRTTTKSRRSSVTIVKDLIKERRTSFAERRRSITFEPPTPSPSLTSPGRSSSRPPSVHQSHAQQRPVSISSRRSSREVGFSPPPTAGSSSSASNEKEKKSSRATRMLRRMSSSLSSGRKTLTHSMSPTVREETEPLGPDSRSLTSSHPSNYSMTPNNTSTNIGDVNVQFPDTLLWKRRSMLLDSQGTLILSPALSNGNNAKEKTTGGATRRFHLSEFRTPAVPDVEMQELPNSVVLDFIEGGGLQIACEDRAGQMRVLGSKFSTHAILVR